MAPEIAKNFLYDKKVDCWAFGVILYFMLSTQFHITDVDVTNSFDVK